MESNQNKIRTKQTYAADSFFKPDGTLNTESTEPLTIVCLGGSLTELGKKWVKQVGDYFQNLFPYRAVDMINAGVGGPGSEWGAPRFHKHVLTKNPDIVIIEFSANDWSADERNGKCYMESMLYQAMQHDKIPVVIFAHTPVACDKGSDKYRNWRNQVDYKTEIAEHYGIGSINIYDYFYRAYLDEKASSGNERMTYLDYLGNFYNLIDYETGMGDQYGDKYYNVHARQEGYDMYAKAFIEAFDERLPSMLTKLAQTDLYCKDDEGIVKASYHFIPHTNEERITYKGHWDIYTKDNPYPNTDKNATMNEYTGYDYPYQEEGMRRSYKAPDTSLSFKTKADAFCFYFVGASTAYREIEVLVDGVRVDTFSALYAKQSANSKMIDLHNREHREVLVEVKCPNPTEKQYTFSFGYIVERFMPD